MAYVWVCRAVLYNSRAVELYVEAILVFVGDEKKEPARDFQTQG